MKKALVLAALLLICTVAFSATSASLTSPSTPAKGTISLSFTASSTDTNDIMADFVYLQSDLNTNIALLLSLLDEFNNPNNNPNLDCGSLLSPGQSNPDANTFQCTYSWSSSGINGKDIRAILKAYPSASSTKTESYTSVFTIDNTAPAITFLQPNDSNKASYESNFLSFDVNDSISGVNTISVDLESLTNETFSKDSHCAHTDTNYHCQYSETIVNTNNENYTATVNVTDLAGNTSSGSITFKHTDTAPPARVESVLISSGDSQALLSWQAVSATDLNSYYIYMSTTSGFSADETNRIANSTSASFVKSSLSNGTTYYFRVRAGDKSANLGTLSDQASVTPAASTSVPDRPDVNSSTHNEDNWSSNDDPAFNWNNVTNAAKYRFAFTQNSDTVPDANSETTERTRGYSNVGNGEQWFHLRACNSSNECGATDHFRVRIDTIGPGPPLNILGLSQSDGSINLLWDAPSDVSGISRYNVYRSIRQKAGDRDFLPTDGEVKKFESSVASYNDDESLTSNIAYYYRIQPVDNAGNIGSISAVKRVLHSGSSCTLTISSDLPQFTAPKTLLFTITVALGNISNGILVFKKPTAEQITLAQNLSGTKFTNSANFSFANSESGQIIIRGKDSQGNSCEKIFEVAVDSSAPQIDIISPKNGAKAAGTVKVSFTASDSGSGVSKMKATVDSETIKENEILEGTLEFEFGSEEYTNGLHELEIEVWDRAGNSVSKRIQLAVLNGEVLTEKEYSFNQSQLTSLIEMAGIKKELFNEAKKFTEQSDPQRKLIINSSESSTTAEIFITVKGVQNSENLEVIEIIPKEVAQNSSLISLGKSTKSMQVLKDDPVIKFDLGKVEEGEIVTFSYKVEVASRSEADAVAKGFDSFQTPPIILKSSLEDPLKQEEGIPWVIVAVGTVLIVLVVGAGVIGGGILLLQNRGKRNTGEITPSRTTGKEQEKQSKGKFAVKK